MIKAGDKVSNSLSKYTERRKISLALQTTSAQVDCSDSSPTSLQNVCSFVRVLVVPYSIATLGGAGEVAPQLRTHTVLTQDFLLTPAPEDPIPSSDLLGHLHACAYTCIHMQN